MAGGSRHAHTMCLCHFSLTGLALPQRGTIEASSGGGAVWQTCVLHRCTKCFICVNGFNRKFDPMKAAGSHSLHCCQRIAQMVAMRSASLLVRPRQTRVALVMPLHQPFTSRQPNRRASQRASCGRCVMVTYAHTVAWSALCCVQFSRLWRTSHR